MANTRLQEKYLSEAVKGMMDKFNYKNVNEIPKIEKVVINMGVGDAVTNSKALDTAVAGGFARTCKKCGEVIDK